MPELMAGVPVPPVPSLAERKKIRTFYSYTASLVIGFEAALYVLPTIAFFILTFIVEFLLTFSDNYSPDNVDAILSSQTMNYIISSIIIGGLNIGCFFVGMKLNKLKPATVLRKPKNFTSATAFNYIVIGLFIQLAMGYVAFMITEIMASGGITNYEAEFAVTTPASLVMLFVYGNIVAPITEELFFRGAVLKGFSTVNQGTGIFVSALLFALFHQNLSQGVLAFTSGLFTGYITVKHGSLIPAIIVHFAINLSNFIFTDILSHLPEDTYLTIDNLYFYAIVIIGIFCLINFFKTNLFPKSTDFQRTRKNIYLSSIPFWAIVLYYSYTIVKFIANEN
jgi:membrane protease YdiL (CAAX protease family)